MKKINILSAIIFSLFISTCSSSSPNSPVNNKPIVLTNVNIIDGTGANIQLNKSIIIENGIITDIGNTEQTEIPESADVHNLNGAYIIPGLINTHVHGSYDEAQLRKWLTAGVTTVRDLGPFNDTNRASDRDRLNEDNRNARIVSATPILTVPNGYGSSHVISAVEATGKVNSFINNGIDIIKFSIEDNCQGRWTPVPRDIALAITTAAHSRNKKVSVHITHDYKLPLAIEAGVDDIAHMVTEPLSLGLIDSIIAKNISWVPTLELWNGVSQTYGAQYIDVPIDNLNIFYKRGGRIALGSDFNGYYTHFDDGLPLTEISLLQQAGMSNIDIIKAATYNAAFVCNRANDLGTIEEGKIADLVVLNSNPLEDISALQHLHIVIHNGEIIIQK